MKALPQKSTYHLFEFQSDKSIPVKLSEIEKSVNPIPAEMIPRSGRIKERAATAAAFRQYVEGHTIYEAIEDQAAKEPELPKLFRWNIPIETINAHARYWLKHNHADAWQKLHDRRDNAITTGAYCFWQNVISQFVIFKTQK